MLAFLHNKLFFSTKNERTTDLTFFFWLTDYTTKMLSTSFRKDKPFQTYPTRSLNSLLCSLAAWRTVSNLPATGFHFPAASSPVPSPTWTSQPDGRALQMLRKVPCRQKNKMRHNIKNVNICRPPSEMKHFTESNSITASKLHFKHFFYKKWHWIFFSFLCTHQLAVKDTFPLPSRQHQPSNHIKVFSLSSIFPFQLTVALDDCN